MSCRVGQPLIFSRLVIESLSQMIRERQKVTHFQQPAVSSLPAVVHKPSCKKNNKNINHASWRVLRVSKSNNILMKTS